MMNLWLMTSPILVMNSLVRKSKLMEKDHDAGTILAYIPALPSADLDLMLLATHCAELVVAREVVAD